MNSLHKNKATQPQLTQSISGSRNLSHIVRVKVIYVFKDVPEVWAELKQYSCSEGGDLPERCPTRFIKWIDVPVYDDESDQELGKKLLDEADKAFETFGLYRSLLLHQHFLLF